mgnify:CR=1 FL=1
MDWLKPGAALTGLLHLASTRRDKIEVLLEKRITSIAYEQIQLPDGSLPLLRPFSQMGGRMAAQVAELEFVALDSGLSHPLLAELAEKLTPADRREVVGTLFVLRERYSKIEMPKGMIEVYAEPPASPSPRPRTGTASTARCSRSMNARSHAASASSG